MTHATAVQGTAQNDFWYSYQHNFPRHLIALARQMQSSIMSVLINDKGHTELRLSFEPYITLISNGGCRLQDIAQELGISKQACNQTVNQLESLGYIYRTGIEDDKRSKLLSLTGKGNQLVFDGFVAAQNVLKHWESLIDKRDLKSLDHLLEEVHKGFSLNFPLPKTYPKTDYPNLLSALPRLSTFIMKTLMGMNIERGHPNLKMSFGQVLMHMKPEGGRIQQMAAINEVSKQAISAIATELETLGYLSRTPDPNDSRQIVLMLTDTGVQLLKDSALSVQSLEKQTLKQISQSELVQMKAICASLIQKLTLESSISGADDELMKLAGELKQRLGREKAKALAMLLLGSS